MLVLCDMVLVTDEFGDGDCVQVKNLRNRESMAAVYEQKFSITTNVDKNLVCHGFRELARIATFTIQFTHRKTTTFFD